MRYVLEDKISSRATKDIIGLLVKDAQLDVEKYIKENSLEQVEDKDLLSSALKEVMDKNQKAVSDFKGGNKKALGAIIGQTMKNLKEKGVSANPRTLNELLNELLSNI